MGNVVMNHAQFMSACKTADKKYRGKANVAQDDKSGTKVNQDLSILGGKGTPSIQRYTKSYLATVKNKSVVKK